MQRQLKKRREGTWIHESCQLIFGEYAAGYSTFATSKGTNRKRIVKVLSAKYVAAKPLSRNGYLFGNYIAILFHVSLGPAG